MKVAKITTTIPSQLKNELYELKEKLHVSMASIYKEALEQYLKQKEIELWEKATKKAQGDKEYMKLCEELGESTGELYEY